MRLSEDFYDIALKPSNGKYVYSWKALLANSTVFNELLNSIDSTGEHVDTPSGKKALVVPVPAVEFRILNMVMTLFNGDNLALSTEDMALDDIPR